MTVLPSEVPLGVEALCDRAGLDDDALFLALPADLAVRTRLELPSRPRRYHLAPPIPTDEPRAELVFRTRSSLPAGDAATIAGWGLSIRAASRARRASCAALGARRGVLVHGAEVRPDWYARGARVAEDATWSRGTGGRDARVFSARASAPTSCSARGRWSERGGALRVSVAVATLIGEGARIARRSSTRAA